jgi:hypothetical protein
MKSASPYDILTGRELAQNLRTDTRSLHGPAHRVCVDQQSGTSPHIRNHKGRLLASFAGRGSGACFLKDSSNRHVTPLEQKSVAGNVRKHRHSLYKCAAVSEEETKLVSVEGSALTEEGKEKEKVITEGWLDGNSFQVWQRKSWVLVSKKNHHWVHCGSESDIKLMSKVFPSCTLRAFPQD